MSLPNGSQPWDTGCCGCCEDFASCLIVWCLGPCINYGMNAQDINPAGGFAGPCCTYCLLGCLGCPCCVAAGTRTEIRKKYGLREEPCNDCLMHFPCCTSCAVCQETRQLAIMKKRAPAMTQMAGPPPGQYIPPHGQPPVYPPPQYPPPGQYAHAPGQYPPGQAPQQYPPQQYPPPQYPPVQPQPMYNSPPK